MPAPISFWASAIARCSARTSAAGRRNADSRRQAQRHCATSIAASNDACSTRTDTKHELRVRAGQVAAAIKLLERRARRRRNVFRAIAALALASTTAANSPATLTSAAPWWERVTVTVTDDGQTHSCRYEIEPAAAKRPGLRGRSTMRRRWRRASGAKDQYTRITFERRFSPARKPARSIASGRRNLARRPGDGAGDRRQGRGQGLQGRRDLGIGGAAIWLRRSVRRAVRRERRPARARAVSREGYMTCSSTAIRSMSSDVARASVGPPTFRGLPEKSRGGKVQSTTISSLMPICLWKKWLQCA